MSTDTELEQGLNQSTLEGTLAIGDESPPVQTDSETELSNETTPSKTIILRAVFVGVLTLFTLVGIIGFTNKDKISTLLTQQSELQNTSDAHNPVQAIEAPNALVEDVKNDVDIDVELDSPKGWFENAGSLLSAGKSRLVGDYKQVADKIQGAHKAVQNQTSQLVTAVKNDKFLYRHRHKIVALLLGLAILTVVVVVLVFLLSTSPPLQQLVAETREEIAVIIDTPLLPPPEPESAFPVSLIVFLSFLGVSLLPLIFIVAYNVYLIVGKISRNGLVWAPPRESYFYHLWIILIIGTMTSGAICLQPFGLVPMYLLVSIAPVIVGIATYIVVTHSGSFLESLQKFRNSLIETAAIDIFEARRPLLRIFLYGLLSLLLALFIPLLVITPFFQMYYAGAVGTMNAMSAGLYTTTAILSTPWSIYLSVGVILILFIGLLFIFRPKSRPQIRHIVTTILKGFKDNLVTLIPFLVGVPLLALATVFFGWPMTIVFGFFFLLSIMFVIYHFAYREKSSEPFSTSSVGMQGLTRFFKAHGNSAYVEMIVLAIIGVIVPTVFTSWQTSLAPVLFSYSILGFAFFSIWNSKHLGEWKDEMILP